MNRTVVTNTSRTIEARQFGNRVRLVVFGAMWSDCQVEWVRPEAAERRFEQLVAINSRKPRKSHQVAFTGVYRRFR